MRRAVTVCRASLEMGEQGRDEGGLSGGGDGRTREQVAGRRGERR